MSDPVQMRPFWEERTNWLPTWNIETEDNAMRIDYIRVYALHQDHIYDLRRRPSTASIRLAIPLFDLVPHIDQLHEV